MREVGGERQQILAVEPQRRGLLAIRPAEIDALLQIDRPAEQGIDRRIARGDAVHACDARTGNCSDFHAYFIALARSIGIPARFAIGATIPADKNEGAIEGYHCWAEFFADERWVPVDISEAWKNPKLAGYYFGHNPANRFELTKGRDLVVDPAPASGPINFLVYPLLEMNGEIVKPETTFTFRRIGA